MLPKMLKESIKSIVSTVIIHIVKKTDLICEVNFIFPYFNKSITNAISNCKGISNYVAFYQKIKKKTEKNYPQGKKI